MGHLQRQRIGLRPQLRAKERILKAPTGDNAMVTKFKALAKQCQDEADAEADPRRRAELLAAAEQWMIEIKLNDDIHRKAK